MEPACVKVTREHGGEVCGAHASNIAKGGAASAVMAQMWASPPRKLWLCGRESEEGCSGNSLEVTICLQPACDSAKYHRHDAPTIWSERAQARDRIRHRSRDGRLLSVRL